MVRTLLWVGVFLRKVEETRGYHVFTSDLGGSVAVTSFKLKKKIAYITK